MSPLILGIAAAGAGFAITAAVLWVVCLRSNRKRNRAVADTDANAEAAPASSASNPSLSAASSLAATLQHLPLAATTSTAPHPTSQPAQPAAQGSPDDDDQLLLSAESLALFERAPPSAQPAGLAPGSRGAAARSTARRRLELHGRVARSAWDSGAAPPAGAPPAAGTTPNSKCDDRSANDAADAAANLELAAIHQRTPSQIMRNPIRTDESIGGLYLEVAKRADRETRIILFPRVANYAGLGLTLKGNAPVAICDVDFASPAYVGGCVEGDILVAINGVPCANWSHDQVVEVFIAALDRERHLAVARGWSANATNAPPPPKPASDTLIVSDWADEPVNDMDDISLLPGTTASDSQPELEAAPAPAPAPPPPIQNPTTTTTTTTTTPTTAEGLREEAIRYQKDAAKLMLQGRYAQAHDCLDRAIELLARTEKLTAPSPAPASSPRRRSLFRRLSSDSNRIVPIQHKDATTPLPGLALFRPIGPDQLSESPSHPHPNPTVEAAPVPAKHAFPRRNSSSSLLSLRRHSSRATVAPALSEADSGYSTDLPSPDVATPTRELRTSGSGPFRRLSFVSVKSLSPIAAQDETQFFTDASESDNVNHATIVHVRSAANLDGDREEDQLEEEGSGFADMHAHAHTQMQTQTQTPTHTHGDGAQSKAGPQRQAWGAPNPHPNAHAALVRKPASLFDKPTFPQPARFAVGAGDDPVVGAVRSELAELIAAASSAPGENLAGDGRSITVGGWMDGLSD